METDLLPRRGSGRPDGEACGPARTRIAPVIPVRESRDPVVGALLDAAHAGRPLAIYYHGGSNPGILRHFLPLVLHRFEPGGPIYVCGFCARRRASRTLRADRVRLA